MEEQSRLRGALWMLLLSFGVGVLLTLFAMVQSLGLFRFVFSLGAIYLGIVFFRGNDRVGARIGFVVLSIVFFVLATIVLAAVLYANGMLPEQAR